MDFGISSQESKTFFGIFPRLTILQQNSQGKGIQWNKGINYLAEG